MATKSGLETDERGVTRCWWGAGDADYRRYHDEEWGYPVADDRRLFEKICLEGFQSGLSWLTILRKREAFRDAFAAFDWKRVARFDSRKVDRLLGDAGIVRHPGKILSTINNAQRALEIEREFGALAAYFWQFEPGVRERPKRITRQALLGAPPSATAVALSKDLKRRGWTFVGPTTAYAFMQAMGLVNDHLEGCAFRKPAEAARSHFVRPAASPAKPSGRKRR